MITAVLRGEKHQANSGGIAPKAVATTQADDVSLFLNVLNDSPSTKVLYLIPALKTHDCETLNKRERERERESET